MSLFRSSSRAVVGIVLAALIGLPAVAGETRPMKGRAFEDVISAEPVPDGLLVTTVGAGNATHLGRFTREASVVVHDDGTFDGTVVFTAANGDQLVADLDGGYQSLTLISGLYTFTGGTGRFSDATGSADFDAVTADGLHADIVFSGSIQY